MCGLVGWIQNKESDLKGNKILLEKMSLPLKHRGPDAYGDFIDKNCSMAHYRLSIIDLSNNGIQPMSDNTGSIRIVYNGEVYNFKDIKETFNLEDDDNVFKSKTDTEVILYLYKKLGTDFVKHLNGMFSLAIWDTSKNVLILARDPYGIKPLFYMKINSRLYFASEIKALLQVPEYKPSCSLEGLYHYLSFNYVPGRLTAFEGIEEFPSGYIAEINAESLKINFTRYFDINYNINKNLSEKESIEQTLFYLRKSIKRQLISDVPVGVMLSGGLDSSTLTALMSEVRGNSDFHTFSIGFDDKSFDESEYARIVASHVGTTHHKIFVTPEKVRELLKRYICYIDEPYGDGSAIPTYLLAQTAKEYVTVLLSGEGGDEFFSGYDTHLAYKIRNIYNSSVPGLIRKKLIPYCVNLLPVSHRKLSFEFKAKRFIRGAGLNTPYSHFFWRVVLDYDFKKEILKNFERYETFSMSQDFFEEKYVFCNAEDDLNRLLYLDYSFHLPDDLMIKNDRMTMAHSLEARVPFTDNELVQFLATVPVKYKLKGFKKKNLLRQSMKNYLPKKVRNKKKVGLEMPYSRWLTVQFRDIAEAYFSKKMIDSVNFFNYDIIKKMWDEHLAMKFDHGRFFWGLLNYMIWHESYIKNKDYLSYLQDVRKPRG
ncbi:MAG: asparagine synthase (glutamine-hydrolyzing) [Spirochaetes bacterium]|nr:asparagine synthase (glutamine-hydrolyzing) [Spirochaetota bacterium]